MRTVKVIIVGGGIGGMALALALHHNGIDDVEIFEAAESHGELGVGINVLPHAVRELTELGLADELAKVAIPTAELVFYSEHGQRIWGEPRGVAAGYRWPQYAIHRGHLLTILASAVHERLGSDRVHLGRRCVAVDETSNRPRAQFVTSDGSDLGWVDGDLVVACDGVHSVVRAQLHPNEGPPKWNGVTMWRGTTEADPFLSGLTMIMAGHFARRVVVYPISAELQRRGRSLINWVVEVRTEDGRPMPRQDWDHRVDRVEVLQHATHFRFAFLDVYALVEQAPQIFQYPMVDRDPIDWWGRGAVTLLGDAAHPMYPVGSNGGSQAIIDARVFARELALRSSIDEARIAYEAARIPATAAIVRLNRQVGPEQCMELVHQRAPNGFVEVSDVVSVDELEEISVRYKRVAGFDPTQLNDRESLSVARS